MISIRTFSEIVDVINSWSGSDIDKMIIVFDIEIPNTTSALSLSKRQKTNIILQRLKDPRMSGPYSNSFQMDVLEYIMTKHRKDNKTEIETGIEFNGENWPDDDFKSKFGFLFNSLKRDGFTIRRLELVKLLPDEIEETETENELVRLLKEFRFETPMGHLIQAVDNHRNGQWASANSQFRTFIESLLIDIAKHLIPSRNCNSAGDAIQFLSTSSILYPVFLSEHLNEVKTARTNGFVNGLWARLHPQGSHPGLSDEEDSTFRYHIAIVFARYLLSRLENRQ